MKNIIDFLQNLENREYCQKRLNLAAQSPKSEVILQERVFSSKNTRLACLEHFLLAVETASQNEQNFEVWFQQLLNMVYHELIDARGRLTSSIRKNLGKAWDELHALYKGNEQQLITSLVKAYCHEFVKDNIKGCTKQFDQWWHSRLDQLNPKTHIKFLKQAHDKRAIEHWRWLSYCIETRVDNPGRCWEALNNFLTSAQYGAYLDSGILAQDDILSFLERVKDLQSAAKGFETSAEQIECFFEEMGTLEKIVKSIAEIDNEDATEIEKLTEFHSAHLFQFGTGFLWIICEDYARDKLFVRLNAARENEPSDLVLEFVNGSCRKAPWFRFASGMSKHMVQQLQREKQAFNKMVLDPNTSVAELIQAMLGLREEILYLLRNDTPFFKELAPFLAQSMFDLQWLDEKLAVLIRFIDRSTPDKFDTPSDPAPNKSGQAEQMHVCPEAKISRSLDSRSLYSETRLRARNIVARFFLALTQAFMAVCHGVRKFFMWLFGYVEQSIIKNYPPNHLFHHSSELKHVSAVGYTPLLPIP